jgi:molecular chaperone DnaK
MAAIAGMTNCAFIAALTCPVISVCSEEFIRSRIERFDREGMKMEKIAGIDLGTTNSEIAFMVDGKPVIIPVDGEAYMPSVVGLDRRGDVIVGKPARNQQLLYPERTVRSVKRKMGTSYRYSLGGRKYTPQEISSFILLKLKKEAEKHLGQPVKKAVITVPAYFNDRQRRATREAGEMAGLEVVRIINEPTAAALFHGKGMGKDAKLMVYDLGGGTFDVSIIDMHGDVIEVLSTRGDTELGGDDFDNALFGLLIGEFEEDHGIEVRGDAQATSRLLRASERAKCALSATPYAQVREEFLARKDSSPLHLVREISRQEFESRIIAFVEKTREIIDSAMRDSGLRQQDLEEVLMVGGSVRIPLIQETTGNFLNTDPLIANEPELCVAKGAAIQAGIIAGEAVDSILVDVTPFTLGIEVLEIAGGRMIDDRFSRIIHRNTAVPHRMSKVYTTVHDRQDTIRVKIYQGENEMASRNSFLGSFEVTGIPPMKAGEAKIIVDFQYNVDGILEVRATEKSRNKAGSLRIELNRTDTDHPVGTGSGDGNKPGVRHEPADGHEPEEGCRTETRSAGSDSFVMDGKALDRIITRSERILSRLEPGSMDEEAMAAIARLRASLETGRRTVEFDDDVDRLEDLIYEHES